MPATNVGKPIAMSASVSRVNASATIPWALRAVAAVASNSPQNDPSHVETTSTSPGRSESTASSSPRYHSAGSSGTASTGTQCTVRARPASRNAGSSGRIRGAITRLRIPTLSRQSETTAGWRPSSLSISGWSSIGIRLLRGNLEQDLPPGPGRRAQLGESLLVRVEREAMGDDRSRRDPSAVQEVDDATPSRGGVAEARRQRQVVVHQQIRGELDRAPGRRQPDQEHRASSLPPA